MTPAIDQSIVISGSYPGLTDICELCTTPYDGGWFPQLKIKETYGMAIINEGQSIKVTK